MIKKIIIITFMVIVIGLAAYFLMEKPQTFSAVTGQKQQTPAKETIEKVLPAFEKKLSKPDKIYTLTNEQSLLKKTYAKGIYDEAGAYLLVDYEAGKIIKEKNSTKRQAIASITKIMTAMVTLDLAQEDEMFEVSENAASQEPSNIEVKVGEEYTVRELLESLLIMSANDSAEVLKEGIDQKYGEGSFIKAMNKKAELLGLKDSNFDNPQGFDSDCNQNYSTAQDIALMSYYAIENYPTIKEIVKKTYEELPATSTHEEKKLQNVNTLMTLYPGALGIKIGNTDKAGKTMAMLSERNGKKLLAILLGAPHANQRDFWTAQLLDEGYQETISLKPAGVTSEEIYNLYQEWGY